MTIHHTGFDPVFSNRAAATEMEKRPLGKPGGLFVISGSMVAIRSRPARSSHRRPMVLILPLREHDLVSIGVSDDDDADGVTVDEGLRLDARLCQHVHS